MVQAIEPATSAPGRLVLPALCLGSFITTLNFAAPAPFLPAMSDDLGVSVGLLGQVTATMMILSAGLALVVGPLADHFGARTFILIGLAATAVSLFDFALAPIFGVLLIASIRRGPRGSDRPRPLPRARRKPLYRAGIETGHLLDPRRPRQGPHHRGPDSQHDGQAVGGPRPSPGRRAA